MQTMPNKTRTAVTVGAVLLVAIVGAYWLWSGNRVKSVTPGETQGTSLTEEQPGTAATPAGAAAVQPGTPGAAGTVSTPVMATPATVPPTHTVAPNETLMSIAQATYGEAKYWTEIEAANEDVLNYEPDKLAAGMTLKLPSLEAVKAAFASATSTSQTGTGTTATPPASSNPAPPDTHATNPAPTN
ncbi:MAG TPA: LysM domain-containing protein [Symbiobacteriaceae bacterium]|jgi:LysM repeat protein